MTLFEAVDKLIGYARAKLALEKRNEFTARNAVLEALGVSAYRESGAKYADESVEVLLSELFAAAEREGYPVEDEEGTEDAIMGALILSPKETDENFTVRMRLASGRATDWFYQYSVNSNYVKKAKLDKNPRFTAKNGLVVTINTAKPEFRDPKKAASGNATASGYPLCSICRENEGYAGRNKRTLRTVSLKLNGENWFWQYSPYGYFYQHGIAVNCTHTPMHVDKAAFLKLMEFVDLFPQYFIGCNAALPRIGGSVLAHDHYQGGGERLPLFESKTAISMRHNGFPEVQVGVLDWFGTAVRLTGKNREALAALADYLRAGWERYEDKSRGLVPVDEEGRHSAVSPTVVKTEEGYELNLILRNNSVSEEFPDGIFHAHPEFHFIKKESIGLIEAQGLFILPGRLVGQLQTIKECLIAKKPLPAEMSDFKLFIDEIGGGDFTEESAEEAIRGELASICERILRNTAVFETPVQTAEFLKEIGFYEI